MVTTCAPFMSDNKIMMKIKDPIQLNLHITHFGGKNKLKTAEK